MPFPDKILIVSRQKRRPTLRMRDKKYSDQLLSAALTKITAEQDRINDIRSKNRTITIVVVGAVLGYCIKVDDLQSSIFLTLAAILVVLAQTWQEYILHKYRHGWHGIDKRTRQCERIRDVVVYYA